jgi:hypothetical protein
MNISAPDPAEAKNISGADLLFMTGTEKRPRRSPPLAPWGHVQARGRCAMAHPAPAPATGRAAQHVPRGDGHAVIAAGECAAAAARGGAATAAGPEWVRERG